MRLLSLGIILLSIVLAPLVVRADEGPVNDNVAAMEFMIGTWEINARYLDNDGNWQDAQGLAEIDWDLGGNAAHETLVLDMNGELVEFIIQHIYSHTTRRWDVVWADTMIDGVYSGVGNFSGDTFKIISQGVGLQFEMTLNQIDDEHLELDIAMAESFGKSYELRWQLTYTLAGEEADLTELRTSLAAEELPAVASELDWFIGEWDVLYQRYINKESIAEEVESVDTVERVLGGLGVEQHWVGEIQGEPAVAWTLNRYNYEKSHWEQMWWDSDYGGIFRTRGNCSETDCDFGAFKFEDISEDGFVWQWHSSLSTGWIMTYTRHID